MQKALVSHADKVNVACLTIPCFLADLHQPLTHGFPLETGVAHATEIHNCIAAHGLLHTAP